MLLLEGCDELSESGQLRGNKLTRSDCIEIFVVETETPDIDQVLKGPEAHTSRSVRHLGKQGYSYTVTGNYVFSSLRRLQSMQF